MNNSAPLSTNYSVPKYTVMKWCVCNLQIVRTVLVNNEAICQRPRPLAVITEWADHLQIHGTDSNETDLKRNARNTEMSFVVMAAPGRVAPVAYVLSLIHI